MRNRIFYLLMAILAIFGCVKKGKNENSKSMQEIYSEKGIPVITKKVKPTKFTLYLNYNATLTGYKQSFASAMVGGRIDKINVKIGDYVKKDSVIIQFPLDAPSAQYEQAKAAYELAKKTYNRMKNLFDAGGISKQQLDQAETQYKVSKANLNAVAQLLKVRAPISGYVTAINVHETDNVRRETILATISQTNKLKARIWVNEDEIAKIKKGDPAFAIWNNIKLKGKVTETDEAVNPKHNAFGVNLLFENPKNRVKSGVIAEVKILVYKNPNAIVVPRRLLSKDKEGYYLYVAEDNFARKRYVQVGKGEEQREIVSGLNEGDNLIIKGAKMVYDNAKIRVED